MTVEYQKVWRTMNDLEMVTSKICSAREIIDNAVDAIQQHKSDKAELLMTAAYEFLEYYLQEFDDKFKLAWQATVSDLRDGDVRNKPLTCDKDDPSPECQGAWNSFWEEPQQYTEEELNAMCDKAELDAELEQIRKEGGFDWTPEVSKKKWVLSAEMDPSGECFVTFPDDLLEAANLKEGDQVEWIDQGDGSFKIIKVTKPLSSDEC